MCDEEENNVTINGLLLSKIYRYRSLDYVSNRNI